MKILICGDDLICPTETMVVYIRNKFYKCNDNNMPLAGEKFTGNKRKNKKAKFKELRR